MQSQFSWFLCILKPEAYAQKLDRSKTPAQLHIMNWHPDIDGDNDYDNSDDEIEDETVEDDDIETEEDNNI